MLELPDDILELYFEEEYESIILRCDEEIKRKDLLDTSLNTLFGIKKFAEANDEWEKSYNYRSIIDKLDQSIQLFNNQLDKLKDHELILVKSFYALSEVVKRAVEVENGLIANNPQKMAIYAKEAANIAKNTLELYSEEISDNSIISKMKDKLEEYYYYQDGMAEYAETIILQITDLRQFNEEYNLRITKLTGIVNKLEELGSVIPYTEVNAFLQNLVQKKEIIDKKEPCIYLADSFHVLSLSVYIGGDFANDILNQYAEDPIEEISKKLFNSEIPIVAAGIDGLDDFLQTTIGSEYADNFHLILEEGTLDFKGNILTFQPEFYIRRFGIAIITFSFDLNNFSLDVSDLRTLQQLVSPQTGTTVISWNNKEYEKLEKICIELEDLLIDFHKEWKQTSKTLEDFHMDKVPREHERSWFARTLIKKICLKNPFDGTLEPVNHYKELKRSPDFKGLVMPLFEGRSALDDWIQKSEKPWTNLAEIRNHEVDLIVQTRHNLTVFMPDDPDWIIQQIMACARLVNEIATLIISFDIMAEKVRSSLILQVQEAKRSLEQVKMSKMTNAITKIRKRSIEITEFELLALQSIQLLRNQGTLRFFDHAEFMTTLIDNTGIDPIVQSLEQKLSMVKESQKGIVRTADDILSKYNEKVSQSQQRLIKVVTLLIAGFAQISLLDSFLSALNVPAEIQEPIKLVVIIIVLLVSGLILLWLGWGYFKSRGSLFEDSHKREQKEK